MTYILEKLYLGGIDDALDRDALERKGITYILSLDIAPLPFRNHEGFVYKHVHALDMDTYDLLSKLDECLQFVAAGRADSGILVHCHEGRSRSATVVLSYLMHTMHMSLVDAVPMVTCLRPIVKPNTGFMEQLELFESMGNIVDTDSEVYKKYRLNNFAKQITAAQLLDGRVEGQLIADPSLAAQQTDPYYKCGKCRRVLFKKSSVLTHEEGVGEEAFKWRPKQSQTTVTSTCRQSLFIEPVQWMENDILQLAGKLSCPKCNAKLGSYIWSGERCRCGTWVTPAIQIQCSKVDLVRSIPAAPAAVNKPVATRQTFTLKPPIGGNSDGVMSEGSQSST